MIDEIIEEIKREERPEKAKFLTRFFKTGEGEYGFGDVFYGISVPISRKIAIKYKELSLNDVKQLLLSKVHEERLIAVFILVLQFQKADETGKKEIYDFYLAHTKYINNWDIVDSSADRIVGEYLWMYGTSTLLSVKKILEYLAKSTDLWEKRIAIMSTFAFIKHGQSEMTFAVADILLHDKHDLIHKAVGWMLREVGKRVSQEVEEEFLKTRYKTMPRTMLRYAIEHFPAEKRKMYLLGEI
jgi:3-methyladenine DNA glycosylase AlkD